MELLKYISIIIKINDSNPEILSDDLKLFILRMIISLFYQANTVEPEVNEVKKEEPPAEVAKIE